MNYKYPNLFIAGFTKCGTTSLYRYLASHPDIYGPSTKEPRYLILDYLKRERRGMMLRTAAKDEAAYLALFEEGRGFRYRMDGTPDYANHPDAVGKINSMGDDTKVILTIRNPVDRLISLYMMHWNRGKTDKSFDEYFDELKGRDGDRPTPYYDGIKNVHDVLGSEKVHIMVFEEWTVDIGTALAKLHDFLGVEHIVPDNAGEAYFSNKSLIRNRAVRHLKTGLLAKLVYPVMNDKIKMVGKKFLGDKMLRKGHEVSAGMKKEILGYYLTDIEMTEELLGLNLESWKVING